MSNTLKSINELLQENTFFHGEVDSFKNLSKVLDNDTLANFFKETIEYNHKNVSMSAFKDDEVYEDIDLYTFIKNLNANNIEENLSSLPCSLRITNVQMLSTELKKICIQLYKETGFPVTVNMYVTPGAGKNCFSYHSDPQETLVYQVRGNKKWFIPLDKNSKKIIGITGAPPEDVDQLENFEFKISKDNFAFLPHGMFHKAEAFEGDLSIHITFAFLTYFKTQFQLFLDDEIRNILNIQETYYEKLNEGSLEDWINQVKDYFKANETSEIIRKVKARISKEEVQILKLGRPYNHNYDPSKKL